MVILKAERSPGTVPIGMPRASTSPASSVAEEFSAAAAGMSQPQHVRLEALWGLHHAQRVAVDDAGQRSVGTYAAHRVGHRQHRDHRTAAGPDGIDDRPDQDSGANARAASWTSTTSASAPTAASAAATDAVRSAPPTTTVTRSPSTAGHTHRPTAAGYGSAGRERPRRQHDRHRQQAADRPCAATTPGRRPARTPWARQHPGVRRSRQREPGRRRSRREAIHDQRARPQPSPHPIRKPGPRRGCPRP